MFKIIYKKTGISSFACINKFKKENNIKKIGHTGTLDPLAEGLLMIATEDDTKLIPYISNKEKEYEVELKLGYSSATLDAEGPITFFSSYVPTKKEVEKVVNSFIGSIKQQPPLFSAKKINGKKAYSLARKNKDFVLPEIDVTIFEIKNLKYNYPIISFKTRVSNGTYIRSLVNDIGQNLKTSAYMTHLKRSKIHGLSIDDKIDFKKLFNKPVIKIHNKDELIHWFNGLQKNCQTDDGVYLLEFNNNIVGSVVIEKTKIVKNKLFGNKIKKILNKGE